MTKMPTPIRPISELRDAGLLWLINRVVFHPRGFALALQANDEGEIEGWTILSDGTETWSVPDDRDQDCFRRAEETLRDAAAVNGAVRRQSEE